MIDDDGVMEENNEGLLLRQSRLQQGFKHKDEGGFVQWEEFSLMEATDP